MRIVFLSNYFNHHQKPLSDALFCRCEDYRFISTKEMSAERKALGYKKITAPYVLSLSSKTESEILRLVNDADVVIVGSAPEYLIKERKKNKKLIYRYSERPIKGRREPIKFLPRFLRWSSRNPRRLPIYLLSASAYAPYEYSRFFLFKNKSLKWGYFTEVIKYPGGYEDLRKLKRADSLLWVARMIDLKHPEYAVYIAERLKNEGYLFTLDMVGGGALSSYIKTLIHEKGLEDTVFLRGAMSPEEVRNMMEKSEIFLFTSDKNEGWGAVLNEAMNSGCAVVASHEIGSVPFLIRNGENGLIYKDGDAEDLYLKVKLLLDNNDLCYSMGKAAYEAMVDEWSPEIAAERLIEVSGRLIAGDNAPDLYESGPCSKAEILKDDWFAYEN